MAQPTRLDYCQYLLSSPINYTLTHSADHSEGFSRDMINRYLAGDRVSPRLIIEFEMEDDGDRQKAVNAVEFRPELL